MISLPIVRSKLRPPPVVADFVCREKLRRVLDAGGELPLTLLAAPAGYGKTSLVAHWLAGREGRAAWLAVDDEESDPDVFIRYFVAAVRSVFPEACAATLDGLDGVVPAAPVALAGLLSNDLELLPEPLSIVVDGYERVASPALEALLDRLLAHPVGPLRLVIISRLEPELSLAALRVGQTMVEVRAADLRFSELDSATLIERCTGGTVSAELLSGIVAATQGWPVAVRLAALALRDGEIDVTSLARFNGGSTTLSQYFGEVLLARLPPASVDRLLQTAIVDRYCAPLCDAILGTASGEAGNSLIQLAASGALLCEKVDGEGDWYRHHHLFHEYLLRRLLLDCPPAVLKELHRRAAAWFVGQGMLEEAIGHALSGEGERAAGEILVGHRELLLCRAQRHRLRRCLKRLPPEVVEDSLLLLVFKAWLMYHEGRHLEIPAVLDRIEALAGGEAPPSSPAAEDLVVGHLLALRSLQSYLEGRAASAVTHAEGALHRLPLACAHARVMAQALRAAGRQSCGDLRGARESIHQALVHTTGPIDVGHAPLVATLCLIDWMAADLSALHWSVNQFFNLAATGSSEEGNGALGRYFLGLVHYQRNELALAETELSQAVAADRAPRLGYRTEMSFALSSVYQALGQADRAREIADHVVAHLAQTGNLPALFRARACQADLALRQGRLGDALEWARSFDPGPVQFVYRFFSAPHLTLARVWIAEGSAESRSQAGRLLDLLEAELRERHNVRFLAEVLALQSLLHHLGGDDGAAVEQLERALALAQPGGLIRLFVDLGQEIAKPLKRLQALVGGSLYVTHLLAALNDDWLVSAGRQQVGADLTRRELKILKLLAVRLSNVEISEELCISRATVKRHTQNIYRKLRASSRREAVVKAKTLKILVDG